MREEITSQIGCHLDSIADLYRRTAKETVFFWRQVPLLALLANGKSGYNGSLEVSASGFYTRIGDSFKINCADGTMLTVYGKEEPCTTDELMRASALNYFSIEPFDGEKVANDLRLMASKPRTKYGALKDADRAYRNYWVSAVLKNRSEIILNPSSEERTFKEANEIFLNMTSSWRGTPGELLKAVKELVEDPEALDQLLIFKVDLDNLS